MNILISAIDANPHRDLARNPVSEEQVIKLVESINRTGFWDNLVIRPHPEVPNRFQLAYGHNRLAACVRAGITEVDLPVRELADYDMLCCMIDENNTQQSITPKVVFENVTAAIVLAKRLLSSTENVNQFNELMKSAIRPNQDASTFWNAQKYSQAKSSISEDGDGLGKDFISHFMPKGSVSSNDTLQNAIDSHYANRRKKAADKREADAKEKARIADEDRKRLEAEAAAKREIELQAQRERDEAARLQREAVAAAEQAVRDQNESARLAAIEAEAVQRKVKDAADAEIKKAAKAQEDLNKAANKKAKESSDHSSTATREKAKSERMDFAGVERDLLEQLDSTSKMNDVVKLIKKNKIPKEFHSELIEAAKGWSSDGNSTDKAGTFVSVRGFAWWDEKSGNRSKRFDDMNKKSKEDAMRKKFGDYPFETTVFNFVERLKDGNAGPLNDLKRCSEYFYSLNTERLDRLHSVLSSIRQNHNEVMDELLAKIDDLRKPIEKDITPVTKMLNYQRGDLNESGLE